jgi:hypothetical protein
MKLTRQSVALFWVVLVLIGIAILTIIKLIF